MPFLRRMLIAALFWKEKRRWYRPGLPLVLLLPQVSMYHRGWGRPGDAGFVAEEDCRSVGAIWYRLFTDEQHGDGYVDAGTPELAVAVAHGLRGRGIGHRLFEAMHELTRSEGRRRISLGVDDDNPAKRLYASLGYEDYEPGDGKGRTVLDLSAA